MRYPNPTHILKTTIFVYPDPINLNGQNALMYPYRMDKPIIKNVYFHPRIHEENIPTHHQY